MIITHELWLSLRSPFGEWMNGVLWDFIDSFDRTQPPIPYLRCTWTASAQEVTDLKLLQWLQARRASGYNHGKISSKSWILFKKNTVVIQISSNLNCSHQQQPQLVYSNHANKHFQDGSCMFCFHFIYLWMRGGGVLYLEDDKCRADLYW